MSYEIIYDKQFIKVKEPNGYPNDMYIPMILAGSNNCYEWSNSGKERRSRSWFPWTLDVGLMGEEFQFVGYWNKTRNEIISRNEEREKNNWYDEYSDKNFGYWTAISINGKRTSGTTFKNIVGVFTNGIKKALTIEELASEGVSVIVRSGYITREKGVKPFSKVVKNDVELFETLKECREHLGDSGVETTIDFGGMYDDKPKRIRKKFFPKNTKQLVKTDTVHNIVTSNGAYIYKSSKGGYNYTYHKNSAKIYVDINIAKAQAKRLSKRFPNTEFKIETTKLDEEILA